jgi:hypothetical protein
MRVVMGLFFVEGTRRLRGCEGWVRENDGGMGEQKVETKDRSSIRSSSLGIR